jgi:cation diffusion facilitator family transporter
VGRSRLEALSVFSCAIIMGMASIEVIQYSISEIVEVIAGSDPSLEVGAMLYGILGFGIGAKLLLYFFCKWANTYLKTDTMEALIEDHLNDVISNSAAIITASVAYNVSGAWFVDPVGAILISFVLIYRWYCIMMDQLKKIVGHRAPAEFIRQVEDLAKLHESRICLDCIRAYHFGARYNVEVEIVLPGKMTVAESHDIALALQHKIESMDDVERAFVHVDHQLRDGLEHKVERQLVRGGDTDNILIASAAAAGNGHGLKRVNSSSSPSQGTV